MVRKQERMPERWAWLASLGFCLISGLGFLLAGKLWEGLICLGSMALVTLPVILERWLGVKLNTGFFLFCLCYAMGPMLGKAFRLYYLTGWWDKLLHTSAGFVFAVLGTWLACRLNEGREVSPVLQVVFGICFSIAVSALWELVEFGVDQWFGGDMQNDTVVTAIHSYLLGEAPGVLRDIPQISVVAVDGVPLEISGYLDIGLIDTMLDVLVESAGAAVYGLWHLLDRNRHPLIQTA